MTTTVTLYNRERSELAKVEVHPSATGELPDLLFWNGLNFIRRPVDSLDYFVATWQVVKGVPK